MERPRRPRDLATRPATLSPGDASPTTTLLNRLDPRQPAEAEIHAAAEALVDHFEGDVGAARLWAIDEAVRQDTSGDRSRNLIAVRLSRAIKFRSRPPDRRR